MKRLLLLLVSVFIMTSLAWSSPVDPMEARNLAQTFWRLHFPEQALPVFEDISQSVGVEHFYIFNNVNGPGFVLVSGDDCAIPILGYSGANNCKSTGLPENIRSWFGFYDGTIGAAVQNGEVATPEIAEQWSTLRAGNLPEPQSVTAVSPLLTTTWDQDAPYNNLCPGTGNNKAYVGCVATAMAQMMKYYNWPTTGTGSHSYVCNDGTYNYGTLSANFGATTYDWANMLNDYSSTMGTTTQQNAVATLMYHCGVAVEMVYTPEGSGAWTIGTYYPYYPSAETALKEHFKYSESLYGAEKNYYTNAQWISLLKNDLDQQHPVIYSGTDQTGDGGHCFVCDGYDNTNNFHFNWGWSGWCDGYFAITSLTPGSGGAGGGNYNYSYYQEAIFGAVPNNGSTPSSECEYLHYPLPGTLNFYTFQNNGGYVAGTNIYGETAKADYFTYSGSGTVQSLNVTFGAIDGLNGSVSFTVWADNNGTPGNVLGSKTVTLNTIYTTAVNLAGNYECVFDNPITVNGSFFAGIDFSNASSSLGIYTNTAGDTVNTGWSLSSNGQWVPYSSPNHLGVSLTHAIHPYVCSTSSPGPGTNTDLHVYSNYTYTPNPLQQNQAVSVEVSVANAGANNFTGAIKLVLLNANNIEAQVIDQVSGTLNTMTYATLQYSGTVTVPAGTYQMAVFSQANGESTWTMVGQNYSYPNPITVTVTGGSTPPGPSGCSYLHYPLPGTTNVYTVTNGGGYVSGTNIYGDEAKADYFTYSGSGSVEKIKITMGAMDGTQGSVAFTVWADNNGTPGAVLGSKTVTLSTIYNAIGGGSGDYECVFDSPIAVTGNFFAGLDISNATSYFGLVSTTDGTATNTAWDYFDGDWWEYTDSWEIEVTNAIFPYVCSGSDPNPPVNNPDLHVYSNFTYTPNPMQQNQSVSVEVSVANTGSAAFNGTLKLALLNANNTEAQVIGQSVITLSSMGFFNYQFSGTVTVPAGTYQMAVYAQATGETTWTLVGNGLNYPNPVSVTVTGGSTPPVNDFNLIMYEDFTYTPNPLQQNQTVTVNASVGNTGNGTFNGNFKLVLLTSSNTEAQVIGQTSGSLNTMNYHSYQFSSTITVMPGTYNMALYYQANGESTWTLVGSGFGHDNPVSVTVTGGSTPPVSEFNLIMYEDLTYTPNPLQQNQTVTVNASVGNTGNGTFNGNFKLVLLTSSNTEAQVIGQASGSLNTMNYYTYQFSGTISVMPGTYYMALYYQANGESTWTLVGSGFGHDNPVSVTVTGGSTPPVSEFHLIMYEAFSYTPNPMQQNQTVTVNASVGNSGDGAFSGSFKLVLLNASNIEVQTIGQQSLSSPLPSMQYTPLTFSGNITVPAGTYQMALFYQATGESTWTLVGNDFGVDNPVSVTVSGGSTPPANEVDLNMFADFLYTPNPLQQNTVAYASASVINMGNTAFTGSLRLALETNNEEYVQTIQQINVTAPLAPNGNATYNFSGNITAAPGIYNLILYYKPDGASNWTAVGSNFNASYQNPKSVIVAQHDAVADHAMEAAKLRPNPAKDHFYLDVPDQTIDRIEIVSTTGQIVHTQSYVNGGESINISHLRSGVYFVRYEAAGRIGTLKLVVQ